MSTSHILDLRRWNDNPFGPGCKSDYGIFVELPPSTTLASITVGQDGCGPVGTDLQVGERITTTGFAGITMGGGNLTRRPGAGARGRHELGVHWWFNQWGEAGFFLCVNVKHMSNVQVASQTIYSHMNMDGGWMAHPVSLPMCISEFGIGVEGTQNADGSFESSVKPYANLTSGGTCEIQWFGCARQRVR